MDCQKNYSNDFYILFFFDYCRIEKLYEEGITNYNLNNNEIDYIIFSVKKVVC
jgi:hypothetical protein